jgi:hypothetical protein
MIEIAGSAIVKHHSDLTALSVCRCGATRGRSWLASIPTPARLVGGIVPRLSELRCQTCGGGVEKPALVA